MRTRTYLACFLLLGAELTACSAPVADVPTATPTLIPFRTSTTTPTLVQLQPTLPSPAPFGPTPTPLVHIVQGGETMLGIALRYGVEVDDLMLANPLVNPQIMSIGTELLIPGAGGEPIDSLLPTPTPLALPIMDPRCFRTPNAEYWCLTTIRNITGAAVEGLSALVRIVDVNGEVIDQSLAYAPLNLLPGGAALPLMATFQPAPGPGVRAYASLVSAIQAIGVAERYQEVDLEILSDIKGHDAQLWRVEGLVALPETEEARPVHLILVLVALDFAGVGVGVTKWNAPEPLNPGETIAFDLTVFSLGPPIDTFTLLSEAQSLAP